MTGSHEYLPVDAPFVTTEYFGSVNSVYYLPKEDQVGQSGNSLKMFAASRVLNDRAQPRMYTSFALQPSRNNLLSNQYSTYLPTSEGLLKYLSTPSVHLSAERLAVSSSNRPEQYDSYTPMSSPPQAKNGTDECFVGMSTMKKCVIGKSGRRLPSVLKKALPLPPEDIRSVPHVRINRVNSPPVVSVGMVDLDGIPTPWSQSPKPSMAAVQPSCRADQIRESMRQDYDDIEEFIQQAFSKGNKVLSGLDLFAS